MAQLVEGFDAGVDDGATGDHQHPNRLDIAVTGTGAYVTLKGGGGADTGPGTLGWQDHFYGRLERPSQ